jgi:hypothetical protein
MPKATGIVSRPLVAAVAAAAVAAEARAVPVTTKTIEKGLAKFGWLFL